MQKPDIGSGDEVTEILLEITPLVRQGFDAMVNRSDLQWALDDAYKERQARATQQQEEETPGNVIMTQALIELRPTETGMCLT